ncbi:MAG: hypothetical protein Q8M11_06305, partial [Sulfuritalea sp.]|nr:hypothetical protein [Sulfuritalea sp.]
TRTVFGLTLDQAGKFFFGRGHGLSLQIIAILPQSLATGEWHKTSSVDIIICQIQASILVATLHLHGTQYMPQSRRSQNPLKPQGLVIIIHSVGLRAPLLEMRG